jgi:hypothetical protein
MDRHELAMKTYNDIQKRKKAKEDQYKRDAAEVGWNRYTKYKNDSLKKYYGSRHTV